MNLGRYLYNPPGHRAHKRANEHFENAHSAHERSNREHGRSYRVTAQRAACGRHRHTSPHRVVSQLAGWTARENRPRGR